MLSFFKRKEHLEKQFPKLAADNYVYVLTSPDTIDYNCVAWAAETDEEWWWPDPMEQEYWPDGVPREETTYRSDRSDRLLNGTSKNRCT